MFERYLTALQFPRVGQLNIDDPKDFRSFVMWLEDQKIRFLPIEERQPLRKINAPDEWNRAYEKYKKDIKVPEHLKTKHEEVAWLLLYAIRLEYTDNAEQYRPLTGARKLQQESKKTNAPEVQSSNPFDSFDFTSADFEEGSWKLAERLGISYHPDHLVSLQAAAKVIKGAYNKEALKEPPPIAGQASFPIAQGSGMGLEKDQDLEQCARILRLLQIQNLRTLQTTINETIVSVQNVTADPRTDTKLGKVGMNGVLFVSQLFVAKMFERYLSALQYTGTQPVNIDDPKEFRSLISWLEDQKIRHYTIENREELKQIGSVEVWDAAYDKYKTDVGLPYELVTRHEQLTWLLLHAVRLEYSDNVDTYRPLSGARKAEEEQKKSNAPEVKSTNPFDSLDFTNAQFEEGARKLADRLGIAYHPDHLVSLRAAGRVIHDCLNKETLKEPLITGQPFVLGGTSNGSSNTTGKPSPQTPVAEREVEKAAQILRLLQIQNMRSMQTTINETIVAVQNVTADPKTDSALGKVGV
uniref:RNA transcription, translation and transport factor protein n=1 Tax=Anopheles epiroticus TaxID=199890 RepID=A0A182P5N2_9DIPT